jgi:trans-aconitate methyltransferase
MASRRREVPARVAWAVEQLDLAPTDRVLEFGCGPGVAASLVADRVVDGSVLAIDRSATAIDRARARNAGHIDAGRLVLEQVALADLRTDRRFDVAFAVNVNLFWTGPADTECGVLAALLAPGGAVHLVYDSPAPPGSSSASAASSGDARDISGRAAAALARHGFSVTTISGPGRLVCITGRR